MNSPRVTALRQLYHDTISGNISNANQVQRNALGYVVNDKATKEKKQDAKAFHEKIRDKFIKQEDIQEQDLSPSPSDLQVLQMLAQEGDELRYLLAEGSEKKCLLHVLLTPSSGTKDRNTREELFDKRYGMMPLLRFLLTIEPDCLTRCDDYQKVPLFQAMAVLSNKELKSLIPFLCSKTARWSKQAIESLGMRGEKGAPPESSHVLHKAIEEKVEIDKGVVESNILRPSLRLLDRDGLTCLHRAVAPPETPQRRKWAEMLVEIDHTLLEVENREGLTPVQYLLDELSRTLSTDSKEEKTGKQEKDNKHGRRDRPGEDGKRKRDSGLGGIAEEPLFERQTHEETEDRPSMERWLKLCCLAKFNNATARRIMYRPGNMCQVDFCSLEEGDVVSAASLSRSNQHYNLDETLLRIVYIPQITANWADEKSLDAKAEVDSWGCEGRADYYLIFHWLKNVVRVDQVLRVVVEDLDGKSHSDTAILNSLKNLNVQTWNWKKLDISSDVIYQAAGSVTEVYLYCSGNNAVLRGWSDSQGLVLLKTLKTIHLEVNQGLESPQIVQNYIKQFRTALVKRFKEVYKRDIDIFSKIIEHIPQKLNEKLQAAKPKILGEEGYEEQQWLKCMDEFADFVTLVSAAEEEEKPVKVAIIDDGVKSAYDNLDANIAGGESWVSQPISEDPHSPYLTSVKGHGTVMAYFIRRICPEVKLYVLKLDPQMMGSRVTFSIESATEAIEWAVKNEMDIISMSWAIDPIPRKNGKEDLAVRRLRTAISKAVGKYAVPDGSNVPGTQDKLGAGTDHKALLFCAWPDKGAGVKNKTYPYSLETESIFTIGAATRDGNPAPRVGDGQPTFFLPGIELGIPLKTEAKKTIVDNEPKLYQRTGEQPPGTYQTFSGSSLSCALAAGLAAMILHCSRKVQNKQAWRLNNYEYMKMAFESIDMSEHKWLAVGQRFGNSNIKTAKPSARRQVLNQVVDMFFSKMDLNDRMSKRPTGL